MHRMECILYGKACHALENGVEVEEIKNYSKQALLIKEMLVSFEGMILLDPLKELVEGTIIVSMKSLPILLICMSSHTLQESITSKCQSVINLPNFNSLSVKEI